MRYHQAGIPEESIHVAASGSRESILIVDDIPANLRLLSQMLAEQGYRETPMEQEEAGEPREQSPDEQSQDETDRGTGV